MQPKYWFSGVLAAVVALCSVCTAIFPAHAKERAKPYKTISPAAKAKIYQRMNKNPQFNGGMTHEPFVEGHPTWIEYHHNGVSVTSPASGRNVQQHFKRNRPGVTVNH